MKVIHSCFNELPVNKQDLIKNRLFELHRKEHNSSCDMSMNEISELICLEDYVLGLSNCLEVAD